MILPALSLKQPWASLIAQGKKTIETRAWGTRYRGPIVICSSQQPKDQGPAGVALCVAMLRQCRPMTPEDETLARCRIYDRAVAWCLGKVWPLQPFRVKGQLGLFTVMAPLEMFLSPDDRHEVQQALEWSAQHDLIRYVNREYARDYCGER